MAKHIIEENIKTIGGKSIIGEGDIEIVSTVKTDGKSISLDDEGALQLGVVEEDVWGRVIYIEDGPIFLKDRSLGSKIEFNNMGFSIESGNDDASCIVNYAYMTWQSEEGSISFSPGNISSSYGNTGSFDASGGKIRISSSNLLNGVPPAFTELTPYSLKTEDESKDVNHTFTFPVQAVNNNSTMVVSVNNQVADEKGNITLPTAGERDFEYEKFVRSFPSQGSVYKYDREKMGNTFGDLFLPISKLLDYYLSDIVVSFFDENGEVITTMELPASAEERYASILPTEVDGKSFYIVTPS